MNMKRDKFNGKGAEECTGVDWASFSDEVTIGEHPEKKKEEFDWNFSDSDSEWPIDYDDHGRPIMNKKKAVADNFGDTIVTQTLAQIASEDEYKADGAFVTGEIDAQAVARAAKRKEEIDAEAIRRSVDDKIVIRSDELRARRKAAGGEKKVKIRVRKEEAKAAPAKKTAQKQIPKVNRNHEKYKNTGVVLTKKKEPSQFRKDSANWRYDSTPKAAVTDEEIENTIEQESFIEKIKQFTPVQYISVVMAAVILVTSVMTTAVYANYKGEMNKAEAMAKLPQFVDSEEVAYAQQVLEESYEEEETAAEPEEENVHKMLSLILTSVEKDLKIKLVDDEDNLVKDIDWSVQVTDSDDKEEIYEDDDRDGIIHLSDMSAGDYTVALVPSESLADYDFSPRGQQVSVKAKVEYKVIANIKDEIKKESEVNVALEDPNGGKGADVETGAALKDTVAWVESSEVAQGDEYEEATVDLSKTENLVAFVDELKTAIKSVVLGMTRVFDRRFVLASSVAVTDIDGALADDRVEDNEDSQLPIPDIALPTMPPLVPPITPPVAPSSDDAPSGTEVQGATLNKRSITLKVGETFNLVINYQPEGAKPSSAVWMSTDSSVAEVSDSGTVTAKKKGKANVGVLVNKVYPIYCEITVEEAEGDESIVLSGVNTVSVGATTLLEAQCSNPSDTITEWKSQDETKAKVVSSGNKATVTGIAAGTVRIEAVSLFGVVAYFDITVTAATEYADDAQLYDSNKNKLYVYDNSEYRLAKYKDYKSGNFAKFYRRIADIVYTGWQTIDGLTYYFTENHEKVTGDQVIGGVTYHFGSDGALTQGSGTLGIDVSKYQPTINWESVKASGINYVIIRCGYRGASTGALIQDPCFYSHIKGAKAAGLKVGVYFFSTALNEAEAVEEASMCAALCSGYGINYPVFIDVESSSRPGYNSLPAAERTANIRAFCQTIQSAGYTPGLYANKTWLSEYINTSSLSCKIWLAQYNSAGPTYSGHYDLWQYTSKGKVDGISGNVDMNQSYLGY